MNTIDLEVQGMSCGSCINHVTQALKPIPGVVDVSVDLPSGHVRVSGSLDSGPERLVSALNDAGYPAKVSPGAASISTSATPNGQAKAGRGGCCCS